MEVCLGLAVGCDKWRWKLGMAFRGAPAGGDEGNRRAASCGERRSRVARFGTDAIVESADLGEERGTKVRSAL